VSSFNLLLEDTPFPLRSELNTRALLSAVQAVGPIVSLVVDQQPGRLATASCAVYGEAGTTEVLRIGEPQAQVR
jgi:hypothetical protein